MTLIIQRANTLDDIYAEVKFTGPMANAEGGNSALFRVSRYRHLVSKKQQDHEESIELRWDRFFKPVNGFFSTLTDEEQSVFFEFYRMARQSVQYINDHHAVTATTNMLGSEFLRLVMSMRIIDRILRYIDDVKMPFPDLDGIGTRVQDTEKMTFRRHEYPPMTAISILCKILCPIWGEYIENIRHIWSNHQGDQKNPELFCAEMIRAVLDTDRLAEVATHFEEYVEETIRTTISRSGSSRTKASADAAFTRASSGVGDRAFVALIFATLLVRKFTNIDLLMPSCNIMTYMNTSIKETVDTTLHDMSKSTNLEQRRESNSSDDSGQGSESLFETHTRSSEQPMDICVIARVGLSYQMTRIARALDVRVGTVRSIAAYYRRNPIDVSIMTEAITASILARHTGGSAVLRTLALDTYADMVAMTQIVLARNGYDQLVYLLTCSSSPNVRLTAETAVDFRIKSNLENTAAFRKCIAVFTEADRQKATEYINRMKDWVLYREHFHNLAPDVATLMGLEDTPVRGSPVEYRDDVMQQFCNLLTAQHMREIPPVKKPA